MEKILIAAPLWIISIGAPLHFWCSDLPHTASVAIFLVAMSLIAASEAAVVSYCLARTT